MKFLRRAVTAGLLGFVAISLAAAVADVTGLRGVTKLPALTGESTPGNRLIAYYFHTATRCPTCRGIEALAKESFAEAITAGQVEWRVVNYEEPIHRHFAAEFKLLCPSVILVQMRDGEIVRWRNLDRVWELNDDRPAYLEYARAELSAFQELQP